MVVVRYPCLSRSAPRVTVHAHAGPVANVRFTADGKYLLTLGKLDRALLVWRLARHPPSPAYAAKAAAVPATAATAAAASGAGDGAAAVNPRDADSEGEGEGGPLVGVPGNAAQVASGLLGVLVELHGLTQRPDLNGRRGYVVAYFQQPTRRFTVRVDGRDVSVKAGHVKRAEAPDNPRAFKGSAAVLLSATSSHDSY